MNAHTEFLPDPWIQTFTGKAFRPLDPRAEDVDLIDIAHALAMTCRYSGHTKRFYSVAEHSVLVSQMVPPEHAREALMHDAGEAYLPDIPRPIKRFLTGYKQREERLDRAIAEHFGLRYPWHESIHVADTIILADEKLALMGPEPMPWLLPYTPVLGGDAVSVRILPGDCIASMHGLPAAGIDAVVTDPPYHLLSTVKRFANSPRTESTMPKSEPHARMSRGFMGKTWDGGDIAFRPETWAEVLRVLKPGGYLVAFGAPKNAHRLTCAIEDAGFEIRDRAVYFHDPEPQIAAFIESLSPAQRDAFLRCLDAADGGPELQWVFGSGFPKSHDLSKAIDKHMGAERPVVATEKVRDIRNGHGRERGEGIHASGRDAPVYFDREITEAATAAAEWQGWGTALKPAYEPIILARKPLEGTNAENVLKFGVGGLNIDGCRVSGEPWKPHDATGLGSVKFFTEGEAPVVHKEPHDQGRWPANVVHDGSDEVLAAFPDAPGQQRRVGPEHGAKDSVNTYGDFGLRRDFAPRGDEGSAARFFYCAKASKADRAGSKHPTVKPIKLIRYLCRLVTPPGGIVLDPFAGSGTTGAAAQEEGFNAILCEREAEYLDDIRRRFATEVIVDPLSSLVGETPSMESMLA